MAQNTYYPEDVLIEEELVEYCKAHSLTIDDKAAEQFVHYKSEQLEAAMESGEA